MGKSARVGESPLDVEILEPSGILSTIGHVESDGKTGGPPSKPKYYLMTDSEAVL